MKKFAALVLCLALAVCACAPAMAATVYKLGSRGTAVRTIQQKLNDLGYADLNVDGVYGKSTVDAVVRYQTANGLKADGKVGRRTMTKMFGTASMDNTAKEGRYGEGSTGAAVSVHSIAEGKAEAMEFHVEKGEKFCGRPLKELHMKKGVIVACISHGSKTQIPNGNSVLEPGDSVVIVTTGDTVIQKLSDIFA